MSSKKTFEMVLTALFTAIIIIMAFVPYLGYINLVVIKATLIHVPVIIGSIVLGPKKGGFLGFVFGCTSLINNTFNPSLLSFAFSPFYSVGEIGGNFFSVIICFVPRILVGVVPYFVYVGIKKLCKKKAAGDWIALPIAGVAGAVIPQSWRIFLCEYDVYRKLKKRHGGIVSVYEGQTPGADPAGDVLFWDYPVFCSGSRNRWKSVYAAWI